MTDSPIPWHKASVLAAKDQGRGIHYARKIQSWIYSFLCHSELPLHHCGKMFVSILDNEDILEHIQLSLLEKAKMGHICALDIEIVQTHILQEMLKHSAMNMSISLCTA